MLMVELGRVRTLIRLIESPSAGTLQDMDRKRSAVLELGNIGDETAVPTLLEAIDNYMLSNSVINALAKIRFTSTDETLVFEVIRTLQDKICSDNETECKNAIRALETIAKKKGENPAVVDRIIDVLENKGRNNLELRNRVIETIKRMKDIKKFPKPSENKKAEAKTKIKAR